MGEGDLVSCRRHQAANNERWRLRVGTAGAALGFGGLVVSVTGLGFLTNTAIIVGFLIAVGYISKIVFSFLVGRMILERIREPWGTGRVWPLVLGVVLFAIVRAIPILGWFIGLIVTLLGLGALWLMAWEALRRRRAASA